MSYQIIRDELGTYRCHNSFANISRPEISIIMGVFNAEKTLIKSIESILNQSYSNIEFIIVNDGSTDRSLQIMEFYAKKDNRIIILDQENIGLTKSLNRAIFLSKGEFIARQDADDWSEPNRLEIQLERVVQSQGKYNFCVSRFTLSNRVLPQLRFAKRFSVESLVYGNILCHGSFFGSAWIFKKNLYNQNYKYSQDVEFVLRNKNQIKLLFLQEPLYHYGSSEGQISNNKQEKQFMYYKRAVKKYLNRRVIGSKVIRRIVRNLYFYTRPK